MLKPFFKPMQPDIHNTSMDENRVGYHRKQEKKNLLIAFYEVHIDTVLKNFSTNNLSQIVAKLTDLAQTVYMPRWQRTGHQYKTCS
jgi:hypothetical protein